MYLKKENVWDYPRPAICEPHIGTIEVILNNNTIAKTDVKKNLLNENKHSSYCEWKGKASYLDLNMNKQRVLNIAWYYSFPKKEFLLIKDFISFYASKTQKCFVNGEIVKKQDGVFYGGWITDNLIGPFKGAPGTLDW